MIKQILDKLVRQVTRVALDSTVTTARFNRLLVNQGEAASLLVRRVEHVETLADVEFGIFSQWGEDGIIEWLVHRLGSVPTSFIELGVENYREANTRFLLNHRHWRGLVIDGSERHIAAIHGESTAWRYDLTAVQAFITRDNVNNIFTEAGFSGELGLLSIDIDGNDYWVWDAIEAVRPHIVIIEYNAVLGDLRPLTVPYDAAFVRSRAHHSHLYFGCSIAACDHLARRKGYLRVGTNSAGNNAFYVRADRLGRLEGRIGSTAARPSMFRESRGADGRLSFARGLERREAIHQCGVTDVETQRTGPLSSFGELYSAEWQAAMGTTLRGS